MYKLLVQSEKLRITYKLDKFNPSLFTLIKNNPFNACGLTDNTT